jgi:UDP-2,3-diacylglucosamine hydrolase
VDVLLVSDLHLSAERPAINERFFGLLEREARRARALYVLGDLFEYWIGDDELDAADADPLARQVTAALRALTDAGVALYVMHGNRDFLLGERFATITGARLIADPSRVALAGSDYLLMHGDTLCTDDSAYQEFRAQVRSPAWQRDFLAEPLARRRAHMQELRRRSEQEKQAKPAAIMDVNPLAVVATMQAQRAARLIHGHTHRPGRHAIDIPDGSGVRWVLPDWYATGGYLSVARNEAGDEPQLVVFER